MLANPTETALSTELAEAVGRSRDFAKASKAHPTRKAYAAHLRDVGGRDQGGFGGRHSACFWPSLGRDLARLRTPGQRLRRRAVERNYGPVNMDR
jgi:hypothetical protein